ncbi:hypothetical protein M405DRAFT_777385 [Rhizopogon salebrosus TDB-379]|nr:hypothetical protein M405DRAFT_777385 [Rhizopogon salebrosus TDB-379]
MRNAERGVAKSVRVAVVRGPEARLPEVCTWFVLLSVLYHDISTLLACHLRLLSMISCTNTVNALH